MRLLVEECAGPRVAEWLRREGHDVFSVYEQARGLDDDAVLFRAEAEQRILVTADKDFGDMIYRDGRTHTGVILMRLHDERSAAKIAVLSRLLEQYRGQLDRLEGCFIVITETTVRVSS